MPMLEPVQIVEVWQPRCALRFGTAPCVATTDDGPRCYNTWGTCLDRAHYAGTGSIAWRFCKPRQALVPLYERTGEAIKTNALPMLQSVSVRSSKINVGSIRDGEKPLGVTGSCRIVLKDAPWDDAVGDYYRTLRTVSGGHFWAKWLARNPFFANMRIRIYEGYHGQALSEMQQRLYILDNVSGPDSNGTVTLEAVDPLRLTDDKRALFPRETDMRLSGALTATATTVTIQAGAVADLTDTFGNTPAKYLIIGSEVIRYTGHSGADGVWTLSGVARGQLGTTASTHSDGDAAQRVGRYNAMDAWDIAYDLAINHTDVPADLIDKDQWDDEAGVYLQGYSFSRTVTKPTAVNVLLGELMRDATFYIWWDERAQKIPLKAVRPEQSERTITDNTDIVAGSIALDREPDERISRVFVYFGQVDPTKGDDPTNFRQMRGRVDAEVENEAAGAEVRSKTIYSKWIESDTQATELTTRLLNRFGYTPRYFTVTLCDDTFRIGGVINVTSRVDVDTEGQPKTRRWQVIAAEQVKAGEAIEYQLQEFIYQASRYGVWMAEDATDYADATPEQRDLGGMWWTDEEGKMPDGTQGYLWQ